MNLDFLARPVAMGALKIPDYFGDRFILLLPADHNGVAQTATVTRWAHRLFYGWRDGDRA